MYADHITRSMEVAISETNRRRHLQVEHNKKWGITPKTIQKSVHGTLETLKAAEEGLEFRIDAYNEPESDVPVEQQIEKLTAEMKAAAKELQFEKAAALRDQIIKLKKLTS